MEGRSGEPTALCLRWICLTLFLIVMAPSFSWAHGFAGKRFFPTTFEVEDPFISDEFSLLFSRTKEGDGTRTTAFDVDYSKRIIPNFGITVAGSYQHQSFEGNGTANGLGNLELGLKYQFLTNAEHETILSVGTGLEIGGTGARRIGADSFSTISPALFFGKGFGDLPESVNFLRPFAITGVIGPNFPTRRNNVSTVINEETGEVEQEVEHNPTTLTWGFTLQYSLQYLQSFVKDVGLGDPFKRMVVLVEFPMETCLNSDCKGKITGSINPGVVWIGKYIELGLAARFPVNANSGKTVGILGLFHLFLDDLFPRGIGKPLFP